MSAWKRNRLWVLRAERRLTQEVVARRLKISQPLYSQLERGYREPDDDTKDRIAKLFGVQPFELIQQPAVSA